MTRFGYTMMCEQSPPDLLVRDVQMAEQAGFDFSVGNRFRLGLGAGENLNEHVVGQRWPAVGARHEMLSEAIGIISALFDGEERVNHRGAHFDVEQAQLWDLPEQRVPIGVAVSRPSSCRLAGAKADLTRSAVPTSSSDGSDWGGRSMPISPIPSRSTEPLSS